MAEDETQTVSLDGEIVELSGLSLRVLRTMEKQMAHHPEECRDAFNRGYVGGLRFARGVCDEQADIEHAKRRIDANIGSR